MGLKQMGWKDWAKGLLAASITGGANALTAVVVDHQHATENPAMIGKYAGVGAIIGAVAYLKKSPVPDDSKDE